MNPACPNCGSTHRKHDELECGAMAAWFDDDEYEWFDWRDEEAPRD